LTSLYSIQAISAFSLPSKYPVSLILFTTLSSTSKKPFSLLSANGSYVAQRAREYDSFGSFSR